MAKFRWNQSEMARGYDVAAEHVHPYYRELQDVILGLLADRRNEDFLLVDLGGGSGQLAERVLTDFGRARALLVDQSEPFLDLARERLAPFGDRATFRTCRLQDECATLFPEEPVAIVSMSAIHHLDAAEKQELYRRCCEALAPGGLFVNADEVRPAHEAEYLTQCKKWVTHMELVMAEGLVPPAMCAGLRGWRQRNLEEFGKPRVSGDDCHETIEAQLGYFRSSGFASTDVPWQKDLWAAIVGHKAD